MQHTDSWDMTGLKKKGVDSADSEVIGSILLISLIATAVAIFFVVLVSQPFAEKIPNINPNISTDTSGQNILILHTGGDSLTQSSATIWNSDGIVNPSLIYLTTLADPPQVPWNGQTWTIGTALIVPAGSIDPNTVGVVYHGGTGQYLLFRQGAEGPFSSAVKASFIFNPNPAFILKETHFTDTSLGSPTSWKWDFGEGSSSSEQNPTHIFPSTGSYYVTLMVTNAYGSDVTMQTISVVQPPPPTVSFISSPESGQAPLTVQFTDTSTGSPISWIWDFGDGGSNNNTQNPTYTFTHEGIFTVILTASNAYGSGNASHIIIVNTCPPLQAFFTVNTSSGNAPLTVQFTDTSTGSPTAWSWNFGDGGSSATRNPSYIYQNPGTYSAFLTVSNSCGSATSQSRTITVNACPTPVASFTVDKSSGNAPLTVQFTDTSTGLPTSWSWTFGDGGSSSAQSPLYTYNEPGTFTATLTATNNCGTSSSSRTILVSPQTGSISGIKYDDMNKNGVRETGEGTLKNWQMSLYLASGGPALQSTMTDISGAYIFSGLTVPDTYRVVETLQSGWSPINPLSGEISTISLTKASPNVAGQNFGNALNKPKCNFINGRVTDSSGNGVGGRAVVAADKQCNIILSTTTDNNGFFSIGVVGNGHQYTLILTDVQGWTTISPTQIFYHCGYTGKGYPDLKFTGPCDMSFTRYFTVKQG